MQSFDLIPDKFNIHRIWHLLISSSNRKSKGTNILPTDNYDLKVCAIQEVKLCLDTPVLTP